MPHLYEEQGLSRRISPRGVCRSGPRVEAAPGGASARMRKIPHPLVPPLLPFPHGRGAKAVRKPRQERVKTLAFGPLSTLYIMEHTGGQDYYNNFVHMFQGAPRQTGTLPGMHDP